MKDSELFDAIAHIDEDLIDRCLSDNGTQVIQNKARERRRTLLSFAAAAAALILVVGLIAILPIGRENPGEHGHNPSESPEATVFTEEPSQTPETTPETTPEPTEKPVFTPGPEPTPDPAEEYPQVIAGGDTTFIYMPDGRLYGWGNNEYGQVGDGTGVNSSEPQYIATGLRPIEVGERVYAISSDGALYGWGRNDDGRLGCGDTENKLSPVKICDDAVKIAHANWYMHALTSRGELLRWGVDDVNYSRTDEEMARSRTPEKVMDGVRDIAYEYILLEDGTLLYGGDEEPSVLTHGVEKLYPDNPQYYEDSEGRLRSCTWGDDEDPIMCDFFRKAIVGRFSGVLVIKHDGTLWRLRSGNEYSSEDYNETYITDNVKDAVTGYEMDEDWGYYYLFILKEDGTLWADTSFSNELVGRSQDDGDGIVQVAEDVVRLSCDGFTTYIVKSDGTLWSTGGACRDDYMFGSIGDGTTEPGYGFRQIDAGGHNVVNVTNRLRQVFIDYDDGTDGVKLYDRAYCVTDDGSVWAWGWNGEGFLGTDEGERIVTSPKRIALPEERDFIDLCWSAASAVGEAHGIEFDKEAAECTVYMGYGIGGATVRFPAKDGSGRLVLLADIREDGQYEQRFDQIYFAPNDPVTDGQHQQAGQSFGHELITVTPSDIKAFGCSATSGDEYMAAVNRIFAEKLAEKLLSAPEGSPAKCRKAKVICCEPDEDFPGMYFIRLAVIPEDLGGFWEFCDYTCGFLDSEFGGEYLGWSCYLGRPVLTQNADGSWQGEVILDTGM